MGKEHWWVENWTPQAIKEAEGPNAPPLVKVDDCKLTNMLFIANSNNVQVEVPTKVKNVTIESCARCTIVVHGVLSSVELVNCDRITLHAYGKIGTIQVDKTDTANICLIDKETEEVKIVHATSVNLNMTVFDGDEPREIPIPSQFEVKLDEVSRKKVETKVSELFG